MANKLYQPFGLLYMILRFGKWKHSGRDMNAERNQSLGNLTSFVPSRTWFAQLTNFSVLKKILMRNAYLRNLIAQSAFLKASVTPHGGHLHAPFLNISYIRIPKSASTSLSWIILEAMYPELKGKAPDATTINFLADVNMRRSVSQEDTDDIFFTAVRNPFARIVSVYRDFAGPNARDRIFEDFLFGILSADLSFRDFVKRVEGIPDLLKDPHLKPQHYFIDFYKRKNPNVVILPIEKPEEIKYFLFIYNLEIPHLNASEEAYDYREYYDQESYDWVSRMYKQDIKMLGYESQAKALREFVERRSV
jgi:hypothetical protein